MRCPNTNLQICPHILVECNIECIFSATTFLSVLAFLALWGPLGEKAGCSFKEIEKTKTDPDKYEDKTGKLDT